MGAMPSVRKAGTRMNLDQALFLLVFIGWLLGYVAGHARGYRAGTSDCEAAYFDEVAAENAKQVDEVMGYDSEKLLRGLDKMKSPASEDALWVDEV